jgi:hypothetical protein
LSYEVEKLGRERDEKGEKLKKMKGSGYEE